MKPAIIAVILAVAIIVGAFFWSQGSTRSASVPADNVSIVNGTQIVTIQAKGGYQPRTSIAKPGIPTILRFNTNGTFDCSSAIRIPSLDISKNLPQSGVTDIEIGSRTAGVLQGSCGMGMYPFEIDFKS